MTPFLQSFAGGSFNARFDLGNSLNCACLCQEDYEMTNDTPKASTIKYLWFAGRDGWQVTSFDPRTDKAIVCLGIHQWI